MSEMRRLLDWLEAEYETQIDEAEIHEGSTRGYAHVAKAEALMSVIQHISYLDEDRE